MHSKRFLFIVVSIIGAVSLPGIMLLHQRFSMEIISMLILVWLITVPLLFLYVLRSDFHFPEYLVFAIYPFLLCVSYVFFALLIGYKTLFVVGTVGMIIALYLLLLTINIINAATVRTVPLLKAARSSLLVFSGGITLFWAIFLLSSTFSPEFVAGLWGVFVFLLSLAYLYLSRVEVVDQFYSLVKIPIIEVIMVTILQISLVLVTSYWNIGVVVRVIYWVFSFMVILVAVQGKMNKTLTRRGLQELVILSWVLFVMVLISGLR